MNRQTRGFSLIELMVAMLLGLIVVAGIISVFLANLSSYHTNQSLSEVQDNARVAFELMARDIRQAGLTGCNSSEPVANVLNSPSSSWYTDWTNAVHGYDAGQTDPAISTGMPAQAPNTSSIQLLGSAPTGLSITSIPGGGGGGSAADFKINEPTTTLQAGNIIVVCDEFQATILQITNYSSSSQAVQHNTGAKQSPGNCTKSFGSGDGPQCPSAGYQYGTNSSIAQLNAVDWYVGTNPVGGTSLYRIMQTPDANGNLQPAAEMVRNVTGMTIQYLTKGASAFVNAAAVTSWNTVTAVQVTLQMQSTNVRASTSGQPISRSFLFTTTLRNRVP